jgi:hypothetical protein
MEFGVTFLCYGYMALLVLKGVLEIDVFSIGLVQNLGAFVKSNVFVTSSRQTTYASTMSLTIAMESIGEL